MVKGWIEKTVKNIAPLQRGFDLPNSKLRNGKFPVVYSNGIGGYHEQAMVKGRGVVTGRSGTIGKLHFVESDYFPHNTTLWVTDFCDNSEKFVFYLYHQIDWARHSTGSGVPTLNRNDIHELMLEIPLDVDEQEAIAETLSDTDAYIAALEKLIAKKKAIKVGTMQELLTGKRRLKGFTGEWIKTLLGKVALDIKTGNRNNDDKKNDGNYPFFVRSQQVERINNYTYDCEAILVPGEGNIGQIFHYINGKFDCHQRVYKISEFFGTNARFIYYYLRLFFGQYALMNTVKATVDSLRLPTFQNFELLIPRDEKEQAAIAEVFSDMDAEIDALTAKLAKAKDIKVGMMQQLLTGQIRLVNAESSAVTAPRPAHNKEFEDAVIISAIVNGLYNPQFRLGRTKVTKLRYLLDRKRGVDVSGYKEKAAGPYDSTVRYKGGEAIAKNKNYITVTQIKGKGAIFDKGQNIDDIQGYLDSWDIRSDIDWVVNGFRYWKTEELEVLATVDNARLKLEEVGQEVTLKNIVDYILHSPDWKAKREREIFADDVIAAALKQSKELFG